MRFLLTLILIFLPLVSFAQQEVLQLVVFHWDKDNEKLQFVSLGSGTLVSKGIVLTNKHVVFTEDKKADFILLCRGGSKETSHVICDIPAGVSAVHKELDVAIVKPLKDVFLLGVKTSTTPVRYLNVVRIVGYPTPEKEGNRTNFGDTKTKTYFEKWIKEGGEISNFKGDKQTITRGEITALVKTRKTNTIYVKTNAIVNFGNSGGGVFNDSGDYIGIPTFKDSEGNAYFLEFSKFRDWFRNNISQKAQFEEKAYKFYQSKVSKKRSIKRWGRKRTQPKSIFKTKKKGSKSDLLSRLRNKIKSKKSVTLKKSNSKFAVKNLSLRERLRARLKQKSRTKYKKQFPKRKKYIYRNHYYRR